VSSKAKPKHEARHEDLEILDDKSKTSGETVIVHRESPESKAAGNGKISRRRNPADKTRKKAKTANELMLEAWKYIWENRHRRLTKP